MTNSNIKLSKHGAMWEIIHTFARFRDAEWYRNYEYQFVFFQCSGHFMRHGVVYLKTTN